MRVRSAVIPVAGFGTRFLPATRSVPKVLFPIFDRPPVHYVVQEAAEAGIERIVLVMSTGQEAIGRYFNRINELEQTLERQGKKSLLTEMVGVSEMADISYVYQKQALGLGHAVLTARAVIGDEPFAVFLPDDWIWSEVPTIGAMIELFGRYGASVIAAKEVPDEAVPSLGILDPRPVDDRVSRIVGMVEKPSLEQAPSRLAIIGRYVLTPEVFDALEQVRPGALGEIQLTDAIARVLPKQEAYAYRFPGTHFDVGTPAGLLKASVFSALQSEAEGDLREWLPSVL